MENLNKNNPTILDNWSEDEKYDFAKDENKWLKELKRNAHREFGTVAQATEKVFTSVDEINKAFEVDIEEKKEKNRHLCHICDYGSKQLSSLKSHLASHNIGERFKCDKCEKTFGLKSNLTVHQQTHNSESFKCDHCHKMFTRKDSLNTHVKGQHEEKRIKCDECSKMFGTVGLLNAHKKRVHVLKSFKCNQCGKRYKTQKTVNDHVKAVHDKVTYACNFCEHKATTVAHLKTHKESIHEQKKNWFCKACPFSSYTKRDFGRHMRIHTGEKPYQCKKCGQKFARLDSKKIHMRNACKN